MGFWVGYAWPWCFHLISFAFSILGFVLVVIFWGKRGQKLESHQVQILLLIFGDPFLRAWVPIICQTWAILLALPIKARILLCFDSL